MTPAPRFVPGRDLCNQILTSRPNPAVMATTEPVEATADKTRKLNIYRLIRDHSRAGGDYVDAPAGTTVYEFRGATYGCIAWPGIACSIAPNINPFFEVQIADLEYVGTTESGTP